MFWTHYRTWQSGLYRIVRIPNRGVWNYSVFFGNCDYPIATLLTLGLAKDYCDQHEQAELKRQQRARRLARLAPVVSQDDDN